MAGRGTRTDRKDQLKRTRGILRLAGRVTAAAILFLVSTLVGAQYVRAIGENLAVVHELSSIRADISTLEKRRDEQRRELVRLRDPQGAVPEIHDRLRLVRPNEALIFVSPEPAPTAQP